MDDFIALKLTDMFRDKAWMMPLDQKPFEVFFSNRLGTKMKFAMSTPDELSELLKHIVKHGYGPVFERATGPFDVPDPINVRMTARKRCPDQRKEFVRQAFIMVFRKDDEPCFLRWEETPDYAYNGPTLNDFINTLDACENDWEKLNFITRGKEPKERTHLTLVHSAS